MNKLEDDLKPKMSSKEDKRRRWEEMRKEKKDVGRNKKK